MCPSTPVYLFSSSSEGQSTKPKVSFYWYPQREKSSSTLRFQSYKTRNLGSAKVSGSNVGKGRFSSSIVRCISFSASDLQAVSDSENVVRTPEMKVSAELTNVNTQVRKLY